MGGLQAVFQEIHAYAAVFGSGAGADCGQTHDLRLCDFIALLLGIERQLLLYIFPGVVGHRLGCLNPLGEGDGNAVLLLCPGEGTPHGYCRDENDGCQCIKRGFWPLG